MPADLAVLGGAASDLASGTRGGAVGKARGLGFRDTKCLEGWTTALVRLPVFGVGTSDAARHGPILSLIARLFVWQYG